LEEWAVEGSTATITCYTLGDDVIAQKKSYWQFNSPQWELQSTGNAQYLLYDGHGSTRQLAEYDIDVTIVDSFSYDGYGVLLQDKDNFPPNGTQDPGKVAQQATSLLYAGEHFDTDSQNYYLRARWYDSLSGRFNRMDPFAGNNQDPQSLHKYLYAHCNPINGVDPTGMEFSLSGVLSVIQIIGTVMSVAMPSLITLGASGSLGEVVDTPRDAFVVSVSASYIFKSLGKGFGGMGLEGSYDMLYINALGRWQDYGSIGWTAGTTGGSVTIEAGPVWNVKEVGDYEGLFFSATYGAAPFDLKFPGLSEGGFGVSVFWAPGAKKARGFKMGPLALTGTYTCSGTVSLYKAGGPFSMGKDIARWFNDNIPAPNLTDTQSVERLINDVKEKLNELLNPLPRY